MAQHCTVGDMDLLVIPTAVGGEFHFVKELHGEQLSLVRERNLLAGRDESPDEFEGSGDRTTGVSSTERLGCWWFSQENCEGTLSCSCGPVTLLEVLDSIDEASRQRAVDVHLAHLSGLYDHFWSLERMLHHEPDVMTASCAECIIDGERHVEELREAAQDMAIELGEVLASYGGTILVGSPRYCR
jgi:hypothetical protein